jgi:hypothetical protein
LETAVPRDRVSAPHPRVLKINDGRVNTGQAVFAQIMARIPHWGN